MRVRYVGPIEELDVAPAGHQPFTATRLEWVDVPADVAGKRPGGPDDPGEGLLAQGDWAEGGFVPLWETEAAKKAASAADEKEQ